MRTILIKLFVLLMCCAAFNQAQAAWDVTIAASGSSSGGSWVGNTWTPSATSSTVLASEVASHLASGDTVVGTTGTGGTENGDIFVNAAVAWSANNKLTLNASRNININTAMSGSGTASSLSLLYGQSAVALNNTSVYNVFAPANLPAGGNLSTKLGSDGTVINYTVITALGSAGSTTTTDLQGMKDNLTLNYALGANIDATATSTWNSNAGFEPVGIEHAQFGGVFEGLGHIISNLFIDRPGIDWVGLFGLTSGTVRNVGLVGGSVTGRYYVGGLVGTNYTGAISNSYTTGSVTGINEVGGLVGQNEKTISTSYATGSVVASGDDAGGLVGMNNCVNSSICTIDDSYATGSVSNTGALTAGGLVGENRGTIRKSYSAGSVTSAGAAGIVGGLVGDQWFGPVSNSFWDKDSSGKTTSNAGTGKTTAEMMTQTTFTNAGWDFTNKWWMSEGSTRPFMRGEYSTTISNTHQLQLMAMNLSANYTLGANIDAAGTASAAGMGGSAGFVPVGSFATPFTGNFDGSNYSISGLFINRSSTDYVGLFGSVSASTLSNVSVAGNVTGHDYVGGLVGKTNNLSTVSNITSTVTVTGNANVGSIVGANDPSTIENVFASGNVTGFTNVGGVVGFNDASIINGAAFSGVVTGLTGSSNVGGLAGANSSGSTISNIFAGGSVTGSTNAGWVIGSNASAAVSGLWDMESAGSANAIGGGTAVAGLVGLTIAETHLQESYPTWDFTNTWRIYEGHTVPLLKSLLKPLTITANNVTKAYDGTSVGLAGVVYSDPTAGGSPHLFGIATPYGVVTKNNVGTYAADIWSDQEGYDITIIGGQLTVSTAPLTVTANNASKTYDGLAYSGDNGVTYDGLVNGETSSVLSGTVSYSGTSQGAIDPGSYVITPSGLTSSNYAISYVNGTLTVNKISQSIVFDAAPTVLVGATGTVSATGGASGNPVTFTSTTTGICAVSGTNGSTVTGVSAGTCIIAANQTGNATYDAAQQVTQNITVSRNSQTIGAISFAPTTLAVGGNTTASATATSSLTVSFSSTTLDICTVSGSTVTGVSSGTCTIAAAQAGDATYEAATQVMQDITVSIAKVRSDFNGDGKSDILWRGSGGEVAIWFMNGGAIQSGSMVTTIPMDWTIAVAGDLNGDGKVDILWRGPNGEVAVWLMNGGAIQSGSMVTTIPLTWVKAGVGDFNGDGKSDILWRGSGGEVAIWFMNGGALQSGSMVTTIPLAWTVTMVGDLNNDGKADILWRGPNGEVAVWLMNGGVILSGNMVNIIPLAWVKAGVGDFNGDGKSDILWRGPNGEVAIWLMNGGALQSGSMVTTIPMTWAITVAGDLNGDGKADILWRGPNGEVAVWLMNGGVIQSRSMVTLIPLSWAVMQ